MLSMGAYQLMQRRGSFSELKQALDDNSLSISSKESPISAFLDVAGSKREKVPRNLSYDSLQKAVKKSMTNLRQPGKCIAEAHHYSNLVT
jgi:hypothetical protein